MNLVKAQEIFTGTPLGHAVFTFLSNKRNGFNTVTDLRRMGASLREHGVDPKLCDRVHLVELFKELQGAGFGKLLARKTWNDADRFKWKGAVEDLISQVPHGHARVVPIGLPRGHVITIRPGIPVELPPDLSAEEIDRFCALLKALRPSGKSARE